MSSERNVLQESSLCCVLKYGTQRAVWGCLLCFNGNWRVGGRFLTCIPDTSLASLKESGFVGVEYVVQGLGFILGLLGVTERELAGRRSDFLRSLIPMCPPGKRWHCGP